MMMLKKTTAALAALFLLTLLAWGQERKRGRSR